MKDKNGLKYFAFLSQFLVTLAANVFVGYLIGYFLDRWLGTILLFTMIFCFMGFLSGVKSVYALILKIDRRNKNESDGK